MGPDNTMPVAAPTASSAEITPMPPATRLGCSSSRTMANASGMAAPARPCRIRAAINRPSVGATAARMVDAARFASDSSMTRLRPYMSPSRPTIGVAMDDDSRNPVTSQVVAVALASRSRWMVVSAGTMSDCWRANPSAIAERIERVIAGRRSAAPAGGLVSFAPHGLRASGAR